MNRIGRKAQPAPPPALRPDHQEVFDALLLALLGRKRFLFLLSGVDRDRALVFARLTSYLAADGALVLPVVARPAMQVEDLMAGAGAAALGAMPDDFDTLIEELESRLDMAGSGVLAIDDAHVLSPAVLADLADLTRSETEQGRFLQVLLCGAPELERHLAQPGLMAAVRDLGAIYALGWPTPDAVDEDVDEDALPPAASPPMMDWAPTRRQAMAGAWITGAVLVVALGTAVTLALPPGQTDALGTGARSAVERTRTVTTQTWEQAQGYAGRTAEQAGALAGQAWNGVRGAWTSVSSGAASLVSGEEPDKPESVSLNRPEPPRVVLTMPPIEAAPPVEPPLPAKAPPTEVPPPVPSEPPLATAQPTWSPPVTEPPPVPEAPEPEALKPETLARAEPLPAPPAPPRALTAEPEPPPPSIPPPPAVVLPPIPPVPPLPTPPVVAQVPADLFPPAVESRAVPEVEQQAEPATPAPVEVAVLPPPRPAPQAAPQVDTTAQRVRALVEQARRQIAAKRLTTPPGDNALETVRRIRELTPQAPEIAQLVAAMVDTYRRWAALAERDGEWSDARSFYERALLVTPDDADLRARLKDAEERSRRADTPQPGPKEPDLPGHTATIAGFGGSADTLALLKAPDRLEAMLAAGANPNHRFDDGKTVLMQASEQGLGAAVRRLLGAGASPNPRSRDGATALMYASYNGHGDVVAMLADAGADINAANADGKTALMAAAARGHAPVVRALLARGAVVDHATAQGWTALMYAANAGQERVARLLVEHGADPLRTDAEGRSALAMGRQRGSVQLVQALTRR